ncbi:hypothetical protein [Consotaella aegiceratis]|uniref:hypothetical protein n=1 Tax=Consotaella aegiceratis TaxID=3097961 RepID=UPI002F4265E4
MNESPKDAKGLNPALKSAIDTSVDTDHSTPAPADSASVQRQEGRAWPMIWLIAAIVSALIVVWLIFA